MKFSDKFVNNSDYIMFQLWVLKFYSCPVDDLSDEDLLKAIDQFESNYYFFSHFFIKE